MTSDPRSPPVRVVLTCPDPPVSSAWIVRWSLRLLWPLENGALSPSPGPEEGSKTSPAALRAHLCVMKPGMSVPRPSLQQRLAAQHAQSGFRSAGSGSNRWFLDLGDGAPASISWSAYGAGLTCTLEIHPEVVRTMVAVEELAKELDLLSLMWPEVSIEAEGMPAPDPAQHRERYDHACNWLFREVLRFRTQHPAPPLSEQGRLERDWLDLTLRRVIEEENRRGYLTPDTWRSQQVRLLEALHAPLGARVDLFPDAYQPVPPRPRG